MRHPLRYTTQRHLSSGDHADTASNNPSQKTEQPRCQLSETLSPFAQLGAHSNVTQHMTLHAAIEAIQNTLNDHNNDHGNGNGNGLIISGRIKSKKSQLGKYLKRTLQAHIPPEKLNSILGKSTSHEQFKTLIHRYWREIHDTIDQHPLLHDTIGIRIIEPSNTPMRCYQILHTICEAPSILCFFEYDEEGFKDYIKNEKKNHYQSLHAVLRSIFPPFLAIELQIRTAAMHQQAETGSALHREHKKLANALLDAYFELKDSSNSE